MTMDPDYDRDEDRALARLLSGRDSLSRPEHESIAAAVLQATADDMASQSAGQTTGQTGGTRWWWLAGLASLAAVGLALWIVPNGAPPVEDPGVFVARGAAQGPQLELRCEPDCRQGGHVALEVADAQDFEHVAVFAFRDDGAVIWYAPSSADDRSASLPAGERGLLPFRIELDDAHRPGRYKVVALFSPTPMDRDAIRAAYQRRASQVAIVERTLEVLP